MLTEVNPVHQKTPSRMAMTSTICKSHQQAITQKLVSLEIHTVIITWNEDEQTSTTQSNTGEPHCRDVVRNFLWARMTIDCTPIFVLLE